MKKLLVLTGPTAVGKTKLSLALAKALNGEIISADSMQVYRRMDIGTDKIRPEKMNGIPHHLIDILEPAEHFDVFAFQKLVTRLINEITDRGHLPILVGGTGFYIQSVLYQVDFTQASDGGEYRRMLEEKARTEGPEAIHRMLEEVDPETARELHANNVKRVIRSLEYHHLTGEKISAHNAGQRVKPPAYDFLYFVLTDKRENLYERIDRRVDQMIEEGLEEEVRSLLAEGLDVSAQSMQGLGYRQMAAYLTGEITKEEAIAKIKQETRHFAKRQMTWFRRERDVIFLDRQDFPNDDAILSHILKMIREHRTDE